MPNIFDQNTSFLNQTGPDRDLERLISTRKVRNVVTVSGRAVRGNFPSWKAPNRLQYESLIENAALCVLEVATLPTEIVTQPCVLELPGDCGAMRYTPDMQITVGQYKFFVEIKPDGFIHKPKHVTKLREIVRRLRIEGLRLILIFESDVRDDQLQEELTLLLRDRPAPGRYRSDVDPSRWDPLGRQQPSAEPLQRWHEAKRVCDDLLRRVIRRDPDEFLTAAQQ